MTALDAESYAYANQGGYVNFAAPEVGVAVARTAGGTV